MRSLLFAGASRPDLGGRRSADSTEVLTRSRVVLAARLAGVTALDQVVTNFRDDAAFERDATAGRDLGYRGKLCIHPSQIPIANRDFSASAERSWRGRAGSSRPGKRAPAVASARSSSRRDDRRPGDPDGPRDDRARRRAQRDRVIAICRAKQDKWRSHPEG
jgi:hypothetical protein